MLLYCYIFVLIVVCLSVSYVCVCVSVCVMSEYNGTLADPEFAEGGWTMVSAELDPI